MKEKVKAVFDFIEENATVILILGPLFIGGVVLAITKATKALSKKSGK